jgi:hypothetical protein
MMRDWTPEKLSLSGYRDWHGPIEFAAKMNFARMKDWEKEHQS